MSFWIAVVLLSIPVLWYLLSPLWKKGAQQGPARKEFDIGIYKDQLKEVERDLGRGVLDEEQAKAAQLEIQRRMLAVDKEASDIARASGLSHSSAKAIFGLSGAAIIGGTLAVYLTLGMPGKPDMPLAERADEITEARVALEESQREVASLENIVAQLRDHISQNPNDGNALEMLGSTLMRLQRPREAAIAYEYATRLLPNRPDIAAQHGEALIYAAQGNVTNEALAIFEHVVQQVPGDPRANYYIGLASAQAGDAEAALSRWMDLIEGSPADAPWIRMIRARVEQLAENEGLDVSEKLASLSSRAAAPPMAAPRPGPTQADVDAMAEMDPEEQMALIEGMVERLADRLTEDPSDLEGWGRLLQAYQVMGRTQDAHKAFETAMAAHADNPSNQAALTQMGRQLGLLR